MRLDSPVVMVFMHCNASVKFIGMHMIWPYKTAVGLTVCNAKTRATFSPNAAFKQPITAPVL